MKKIGIIVGHNTRSQGAKAFNGITEYEFNKIVWHMLTMMDRYRIDWPIKRVASKAIPRAFELVFFSLEDGRDSLISSLNRRKIHAMIELHFNGFKEVARGVECLYLEGTEGEGVASHVSGCISNHYGSKLRGENGAVKLSKGDRGSYNLKTMAKAGVKAPIIVEPCFANFKTKESKAVIGNPLEYANVLYKAIESFYGGSDGEN